MEVEYPCIHLCWPTKQFRSFTSLETALQIYSKNLIQITQIVTIWLVLACFINVTHLLASSSNLSSNRAWLEGFFHLTWKKQCLSKNKRKSKKKGKIVHQNCRPGSLFPIYWKAFEIFNVLFVKPCFPSCYKINRSWKINPVLFCWFLH